MSLFHAGKWLHKSFRSDCIVFPGGPESITEPRIVGFQYSRPVDESSFETPPKAMNELQIYSYPAIPGGSGSTKATEIYSLGLVLLEIAYWRPIFEDKYINKNLWNVSSELKSEVHGKFGRDLEGTVGSVLMSAVRWCLACPDEFGPSNPHGAAVLSTLFFQNVVEPLEALRA